MTTVWAHHHAPVAAVTLCAVVIGIGVAGLVIALWPPK